MRLMSAIRRLTLLHRPFDGRTVGPGPATGFAVWQTMFGGEGGYGRREPDQGRPSYDRDDLVGHGWSVTVMVAKSRRRGRNYGVVYIGVYESPLTPALVKVASTMSLDRTILLKNPCAAMKRFIRSAPRG
jgi:hypothetical protein